MRTTTPSARGPRVLLAVALCLPAAGCQDPYLARRDTMTLGSGEAVQANIAKQVIDPWPAHAQQIDRDSSGERAQHAIERYRNSASGTGAGAGSVPPPVPVGPANVPSAAGSGFR